MTPKNLDFYPTVSSVKLKAVDFNPFMRGELAAVVPTTDSQKEVWLAAQLGEGANCAYNESQTLRLQGKLHTKALQQAVQQLVLRHEALRASFSPGDVSLCIATNLLIEVPLVDLSEVNDRVAQLDKLRQQAVETPFDLVHDALFRATIVRCAPEEHFLIMTGHHIVCDGWSWGVLLPDLATIYSALSARTVADLDSPACFSNYALAQHEGVYSQDFATAEAYWLKQFSGAVPVLDFPLDRPRPALKTYPSRREDWTLDPDLVKNLKKVGAKAKCSFFTTLLAGVEVWLHRLTGQTDLVVGTPAAGQSFSGMEGLVGHCVNFLPLRSQIDPSQPFVNYLRLRSSEVLDAYEHQQLTFGSLVKKLAIPRDPSRIPLVSAVFNYDRGLTPKDMPFAGLEVELSSNPRSFENFDLFVNASDANGKLVLECQYNTDLFDAETIQRRMAELEALLVGVVSDPTQLIGQLPIVPNSEHALLHLWNRTQKDFPPVCLHQLIEAQVDRTPNKTAVVFGKQSLTYRELDRQANQLASYLRSRGVGSEVLVGICLERSLQMVVGMLAILKAGGAYVPLDPAHPVDRLSYILQDTAAPLLLTQRSLVEKLPASTAQVICLDDPATQQLPQAAPVSLTPANLAYVIYTSGSTGQPKGVQIEHRSAVNLLNSVRSQPGLTENDVLLAVATITFDISVAEIFLPLSVGAQLVVASRETATDGAKLAALLQSSGTTFFQPTPATWQLLLATGWQGSPRLTMISTGEPLTRELANQLLPKGKTLWNLYGPTETTIWSSTYQVISETGPVLIGRPLDNTQFHILDSRLQLVPIGVSGELYIGGDGLARGYLNRPELTADRFTSSPFVPGERLYKTGDLARFLPDGTVECLGRLDYQVKVRGFRIELGEIESALRQHAEVQEAVVVAREDSLDNKRLVAYVIPRSHSAPTVTDLRNFISRSLPDYMVPSAIVFLESFPLTGSGKVDRKALPKPEVERRDESNVAPRSQTERELVQIWEAVLDVHPIGIHDNFFDLGGHSLLAVRLWSQIESAFQTKLPLSTLFQAQTIAALIDRLGQNEPTYISNCLFVIQPGLPNTKRKPIFCLHVLGEGCSYFRPLANHLSTEFPVYGLAAQMLNEATAPPNQVEPLAAYYIQEMQALQPEGPYYVLGISFGGSVAFEVARQLAAQGQQTALVGLMDTHGSSEPTTLETTRLLAHLRNFRTMGPAYLSKKVGQRLGTTLEINWHWLLSKCYGLCKHLNLPAPYFLHSADVRTANVKAATTYKPQPYAGKVTVFRATEEVFYSSAYLESGLGWKPIALGGVDIEDVPGSHMGMLTEPNVRVLAAKLQHCIDRNEDFLNPTHPSALSPFSQSTSQSTNRPV